VGLLAEIPYPRIDPILLDMGMIKVRWYGISYVLTFGVAYLVLRMLAKRGRWPVPAEKVADVLFWGILGVFLGGRLGYVLFYQIPMGNFTWSGIYRVWEGGMSFHGGLIGVVIAYAIYAIRTKTPFGTLFDGLALATPIGIFLVRMANFINAELYGRVWNGPWAMRFPDYEHSYADVDGKRVFGAEFWEPKKLMLENLRHPSQLYEGILEGLLLYAVLYWLMIKRGWGGGMISGAFLMGYGTLRFFIEFTRQPDKGLDFPYLDVFTQGQALCVGMIVLGAIVYWRSRKWTSRNPNPETTPA
jgi:phosphatidylglycerol:prolipoprotein diacylglycerol transferase